MGSSGKKKTTMAKLAREHKLRERRLNKQARKDARKQAAFDQPDSSEVASLEGLEDASTAAQEQAPVEERPDEAVRTPSAADAEPADPRAKEAALMRLRDSGDEELAVFEGRLRDNALGAGATEQEMREAQRDHPGHGG